jgi:amino acid transporter
MPNKDDMNVSDLSASPTFRLSKVLGVFTIMASAVAGEYGAGINFVSVQSLSVYPSVRDLVPLAMFVTGALLITKVYLFSRYSRAMPRAGSAYVWMVRSLNLPIGFIASFIYWIGYIGGMGFLAFAFGTFLGQALLNANLSLGRWLLTANGHVIIGLAAIWSIYFLHIRGVRYYGLFVNILFMVILATAFIIAIYGFSTAPDHFVAAARLETHLGLARGVPLPPLTGQAFFSVCALFVFAYGGLSAAPYLGGEAKNAEQTMPRGIFLGWIVSVALFTLVAASLFHAAPYWAVIGLIRGKHAALATAPGLIGVVAPHFVGIILELLVALIVGKTIAPGMLVNSRILFAWGEDHLVPSVFAETNRYSAPTAALTVVAFLASLFLMQTAYIGWALGVVMRALSTILIWFLVAIAAIVLRQSRRFANVDWAIALRSDPWLMVAALASLIICAVLAISIAVVPHTPFVFQPLFQSAVAGIFAWLILSRAQVRARLEKFDINTHVELPPID